jgi:hypothetical protein
MVTVAVMSLELEYLVKILYWGRSRSRYIFTDSTPPEIASDSAFTALINTPLI